MIKKQKQKKTVPPKIVNLSENRKPFNHPPPKKKPNLRLEIWNQNSDLPRVPPANKVRCGICGLIITGGAEGGVTQEMRRQTASPSSTHLFSCYTSACSAATASRRHTINFSLSHPRARTSPRAKHGGVPPPRGGRKCDLPCNNAGRMLRLLAVGWRIKWSDGQWKTWPRW